MVHYNTDINIIGSIPDYTIVYKAINLHSQTQDALEDSIIKNNDFDFRTQKSRKRFVAALYSAFINFKNPHHKELIENIFSSELSLSTKQLTLFWQFSLVNPLFYEINKDVFVKNYFSGRVSFAKEDIVAYIKELISKKPQLKEKWSELTIQTIASKYLTILKKLDLLEGTVKKTFKHIQISNESLLVFIELALAVEPDLGDFFKSKYLPLIFMSKESFLQRAKELAMKDSIELSYNGTALKLESKNTLIKGE
jgi:hypothetical protein